MLKILPPIDSATHDIEYGEDEVIIIHLPEDATGTVTIVVDGKSYTAPLVDGKATFKIPGLKVGEYGVDVYYSGDDKYLPTNTTDSFKVNETVVPDNKGHTGIDLTRHATGNPILVLVMILMVCGAVLKRSFKKWFKINFDFCIFFWLKIDFLKMFKAILSIVENFFHYLFLISFILFKQN